MKKQLLKERFQQLAGIKSLSEVEAFGAAGTDKRTQQVITDIIQLIKSKDNKEIIVPTYIGQQGNPILFSKSMKSIIISIEGVIGAKKFY